MSSHAVYDDHDELTDIGSLRHEEIDKIILEGLIPDVNQGPTGLSIPRVVGIPLLPSDNTFSGINTFSGTVNVDTLNVLTQNNVSVNSLTVDDPVIAMGYSNASELPSADRGIIFSASGPNPSMFWDHSELEFRFGLIDADPSTTEFQNPDDPAQGGYANLHVGDIIAGAITTTSVTSSGLISTQDISVLGAVTVPTVLADEILTTTGEDYLLANVIAGSGIQIGQDPGTGQMVISKLSRLKETMIIQTRYPSSALVTIPNTENLINFDPAAIDVFINGVLVLEGSNLDYTIQAGGITFSFPLETNDVVTVIAN
jgi:hypothetical protein